MTSTVEPVPAVPVIPINVPLVSPNTPAAIVLDEVRVTSVAEYSGKLNVGLGSILYLVPVVRYVALGVPGRI